MFDEIVPDELCGRLKAFVPQPELLVVPEKAEKGFREGLRKFGLIFPAG